MAYKKQAKQVEVQKEEVVEQIVEKKETKNQNTTYTEFQLGIAEYKVLDVEQYNSIKVKNLGGGDLQVGDIDFSTTSSSVLYTGEEKEFKNAKTLYITSSSRPFVKVSFIE